MAQAVNLNKSFKIMIAVSILGKTVCQIFWSLILKLLVRDLVILHAPRPHIDIRFHFQNCYRHLFFFRSLTILGLYIVHSGMCSSQRQTAEYVSLHWLKFALVVYLIPCYCPVLAKFYGTRL